MNTTTQHRLVRAAGAFGALALLLSGCAGQDPPAEATHQGWSWLAGTESTTELTLHGGVEKHGDVLVFDGVTGYASAPAPLRLDTTKSFTVAAWVSYEEERAFANVVSQIGDVAASFFLGRIAEDGAYNFSMKDADTNDPGHTIRAQAGRSETDASAWVHLAGVFDADAGALTLYVDGENVAETDFDAPWQAAGSVVIGASQAHGTPSDFWPGAITQVHLVPAMSSEAEVAELMNLTRPSGEPPTLSATDPSSYGDGVLDGTWEYVLTPDEAAFVNGEIPKAERGGIGDLTALRLGFDSENWWQGMAAGDDLWLVDGVPEGDRGVFTIEGDSLTTDNGFSVVTYDWSLTGEQLTLVVTDCANGGEPCDDLDMVKFINERTWTRISSDASY